MTRKGPGSCVLVLQQALDTTLKEAHSNDHLHFSAFTAYHRVQTDSMHSYLSDGNLSKTVHSCHRVAHTSWHLTHAIHILLSSAAVGITAGIASTASKKALTLSLNNVCTSFTGGASPSSCRHRLSAAHCEAKRGTKGSQCFSMKVVVQRFMCP